MRYALKGFTLIELMIVLAIIGILAAVAIPAYQNRANGGFTSSKERCLGGMLHINQGGGNFSQVFNEHGGGIPCKVVSDN